MPLAPSPGARPAPTARLHLNTAITIKAVTDVAGIEALQPDYERLQRVTGNTLPFALYEWHSTWCSHFLNCYPSVHGEPLFYVLRDATGACDAVVPFIISRRRLGPLKIVSIDLLGADPAITEIRVPLIEPGYEQLTATTIRRQLAGIPDWDWIHWRGIDAAFRDALAADGGNPQWAPVLSDFVLDLKPTWEAFRLGLKRAALGA